MTEFEEGVKRGIDNIKELNGFVHSDRLISMLEAMLPAEKQLDIKIISHCHERVQNANDPVVHLDTGSSESKSVEPDLHDYFNCLHNTKCTNGKYMSRADAELLADALANWKPHEGYERGLCVKGHLHSADCYLGLPDKCPDCKQPFVWREGADQTNGESVETKLRVKTKTPRMVKVYDYTYHVPKEGFKKSHYRRKKGVQCLTTRSWTESKSVCNDPHHPFDCKCVSMNPKAPVRSKDRYRAMWEELKKTYDNRYVLAEMSSIEKKHGG